MCDWLRSQGLFDPISRSPPVSVPSTPEDCNAHPIRIGGAARVRRPHPGHRRLRTVAEGINRFHNDGIEARIFGRRRHREQMRRRKEGKRYAEPH